VLSAALARTASLTLTAMPGGLTAPLGEVIGTLAWAMSPVTRENVLANLRIIAPERANASTARKVFVGQSRNYLDIFQLPKLEPNKLIAAIDHRGWDNFLRAHAQGRGVIIASAHLGPIPVVGQMLCSHGYEVVLTIETERSELQRAINRKRASMGLQFAFVENPFPAYRAVRQHKVLGLLVDRAVTNVGERVPFFGRPALLPSVHVVLGHRTGAPVVPAFALREGGRLTACFEPPLDIPHTGDREADVREGVRRWGEVLERYIRKAPEQWAVFERFWER
jgi:phosphatidylinositol dimannoside acyltransferase